LFCFNFIISFDDYDFGMLPASVNTAFNQARNFVESTINTGEVIMNTLQKGFTLIELMIVIAIIGILAAVAVPQYQDYIIRTQVTEGLSLAAEVKTAVNDFYAAKSRLPTTNTSVGVGQSASLTGNYVTAVAVGNSGGITITYGARASAKIAAATLGLGVARNTAGGLVWICGNAGTPAGATEAAAQPTTSVVGRYLSSDCRS
jgi:type IV pilus assembly protein PilA